ncbi:RTA1 like protein-domain-containing protein [Umbelopsis sp. PMI_123]|nr:RTA1 like protein-domain-containing protein [Umbelopsis sp. PMI_123]
MSNSSSLNSTAFDANNTNIYGYTPDLVANVIGIALFGLAWAVHTVFALHFRHFYFGVALWIGCGLETAGYVARTLSHYDAGNMNDFIIQIVCLTIGPAFIMGGIYYMLAKFTIIYGLPFSKLRPRTYSLLFITLDLISIILQGAGGAMAATALQNSSDSTPGTHIMVAGICFQVFSMLVFMFFCSWFMYNVHQGPSKYSLIFNPDYANVRESKYFKPFHISITVAVITIFIRCIYRVVELVEGWSGYLMSHEPYFLILDGIMLAIAVIALLVPHPGFVWGRQSIRITKTIK